MDITKIFCRASDKFSLHWKLEGFSSDASRTIYVAPVVPGDRRPPPLLLSCLLEQQSPSMRKLVSASDNTNSPVTEEEVERIARGLIARLDGWTERVDLTQLLKSTTMGSSFRIEEGYSLIRNGVWLAPNNELQKRYLPLSRLASLWRDLSFELPPTLDFDDLQSISRLHDSVSISILPSGETVIFKGAVRIVARLYHELRELLRMPPHPNIAARPKYLVIRKVPGRQQPILCGFVLKYYRGGSLLESLARYSLQKSLSFETKLKWIREIIAAFRHLHSQPDGFYSDLRLDNIVLDENQNVVLVDFEQYGSGRQWFHPALWNWKKLRSSNSTHNTEWAQSAVNPANMPHGIHYSNPKLGYLKCFTDATDRDRQGWEAYSIAKVMWCIFEEETNQINLLNLREEELQIQLRDGTPLVETVFPHFRQTPPRMRYWIWLCTRHSWEWGHVQCKCASTTPDVCGLWEQGNALAGILDTHLYFEASLLDEVASWNSK